MKKKTKREPEWWEKGYKSKTNDTKLYAYKGKDWWAGEPKNINTDSHSIVNHKEKSQRERAMESNIIRKTKKDIAKKMSKK